MKRILAIVGMLAFAAPAFAGQWSFSFPARYCQSVPSFPVTAVTLSGNAPKDVWDFPASTGFGDEMWCDVKFPEAVNSNVITASLTWSVNDSTPNNVGWSVQWEVTPTSGFWASNGGNDSVPATTITAVPTAVVLPGPITIFPDALSSIAFVAMINNSTPCPLGAVSNTCSGRHGVLLIRRLPTSQVTSDSQFPVHLERVNLTGFTP